jgi:glycosyltransferase involved in cell wall biosynthesis
LDDAFLTARRRFGLKTALVTYVVSGGLQRDHRPVLFRAIREADMVVGNSRHMGLTAEKLGGGNVQTVYDGVDRRYYYPPDSRGHGPLVVLFAGSFRPYKRADLVVREGAKHPDSQFRLAGTGEEEGSCRQLASRLGCRNVQFLGHLTAARLGEEMRRADIFFFPSEVEGHPQVLLQAAASGLPCIARRSYEPDYVVDQKTGFLGKTDAELSDALDLLTWERDLRHQFSIAAVQHALQFDWDSIAKQWQDILERAAANRAGNRQSLGTGDVKSRV